MPWSFDIREASANCYLAVATRNSGESISKEGDERVIAEVISDAYKREVELGTLDSRAAYSVSLDYLSAAGWTGEYHEKIFGSWSIKHPKNASRAIHYDGRDFYLMISREPGSYSWQGEIKQLLKGRCHYFREISSL